MPSAGADRHNFKFNKERKMRKVKTNSQTQGLSIKNKILLAFGIILLLMVFISANSLFRLNEAKDKISKIVTEDYPTTALGNNVIREVNNATTLLLNAIIEKEPERKDQLLQALNAKSKEVTALYEQLRKKQTMNLHNYY
jgi:methyl-accepting chemotaxis protein-2 (aspartate sensor receptor)